MRTYQLDTPAENSSSSVFIPFKLVALDDLDGIDDGHSTVKLPCKENIVSLATSTSARLCANLRECCKGGSNHKVSRACRIESPKEDTFLNHSFASVGMPSTARESTSSSTTPGNSLTNLSLFSFDFELDDIGLVR